MMPFELIAGRHHNRFAARIYVDHHDA